MKDSNIRHVEVDLSFELEVTCDFCGSLRVSHDFRILDRYMDEYRRQKVRFIPLFPKCCSDYHESVQMEYISYVYSAVRPVLIEGTDTDPENSNHTNKSMIH